MPPSAVEKPDWAHIDTVLLDLDGTLLDLAYDNHFWLEIVPAAYAAARMTTVEAARTQIAPWFRAREGTLPWYCIDHWSRELGLDIEALKRANTERIAWLPGAKDFLLHLRAAGKRVVLLTNSHPQVLRIKDEKQAFSAISMPHSRRTSSACPRRRHGSGRQCGPSSLSTWSAVCSRTIAQPWFVRRKVPAYGGSTVYAGQIQYRQSESTSTSQ